MSSNAPANNEPNKLGLNAASMHLRMDWGVDAYVARFEEQWMTCGCADFLEFLPETSDADYSVVAMELMRVDAELAVRAGEMRNIEYYLRLMPQVLAVRENREQLEFELSRLSAPSSDGAIALERSLSGKSPAGRQKAEYPKIGEVICGFELLAQLGFGAFSRVYLASENSLSRRLVILKFSTKFPGEASTLARLQHKNIVPIYSWHQSTPFHIVCMPFLGSTTLWDFLRQTTSAFGERSDSDLYSHRSGLGDAIVSTIQNRRSQTLAELRKHISQQSGEANQSVSGRLATDSVATTDSAPSRKEISIASLEEGLSKEVPKLLASQRTAETVLWIGRELAEGLMHAHERGVLHRDIKPANVLLSDDGIPMLLDFNLAVSRVTQSPDSVVNESTDGGGTPRYMSPEQLRSLTDPSERVDARSDLFSLGVLLFELAVGRSPYSEKIDDWRSALPDMIQQRESWNPGTVEWPSFATPAVQDVLAKLLAYDPKERYPSARALHEDLDRQLNHLPLVHAPNRSLVERVSKWSTRNPRLSSGGAIAGLLGSVILCTALLLFYRQHQIGQLQSQQWLTQLEKAQLPAQATLAQFALPQSQVESMISESESLVASAESWNQHARRLNEIDRRKAEQLLGQLFSYRARGRCLLAAQSADSNNRKTILSAALRDFIDASKFLKEGQSANDHLSKAVEEALQSNSWDTSSFASLSMTALSPTDLSPTLISPELKATDASLTRANEAKELQKLLGADAANPWYWWLVGYRQFLQGDHASALASANVSRQLDTDFPWSSYLIALIQLDRNQYASAEQELTRLIDTKKLQSTEIYMNRAIARLAQQKAKESVEDLNRIEDDAERMPRIYFLLEQAYRAMGQLDKANEALASGLKTEPTEGHGFIARADARLRQQPADPQGALTDLKKAAEMLPTRALIYENQAFILSEMMNRPDDAIGVLTQGIEKTPNLASLFASRATLYGRMKDIVSAKRDIGKALEMDRSALVCYQAASALLLASDAPTDRTQAIALLKETLRKDPSLKRTMDADRDLIELKSDHEFEAVLAAASVLQ